MADLDKQERDSADFIRPQKAYADMVVRFQPPPKEADDAHLDANLTLYRSLYRSLAQPDLTRLVSHLDEDTPSLRLSSTRDGDRAATVLHIAGIATDPDVIALEQLVHTEMGLAGVPDPHSIGVFPDGVEGHQSRPLAITQLLIAYDLLRCRHRDTPDAVELAAV